MRLNQQSQTAHGRRRAQLKALRAIPALKGDEKEFWKRFTPTFEPTQSDLGIAIGVHQTIVNQAVIQSS